MRLQLSRDMDTPGYVYNIFTFKPMAVPVLRRKPVETGLSRFQTGFPASRRQCDTLTVRLNGPKYKTLYYLHSRYDTQQHYKQES